MYRRVYCPQSSTLTRARTNPPPAMPRLRRPLWMELHWTPPMRVQRHRQQAGTPDTGNGKTLRCKWPRNFRPKRSDANPMHRIEFARCPPGKSNRQCIQECLRWPHLLPGRVCRDHSRCPATAEVEGASKILNCATPIRRKTLRQHFRGTIDKN